MRRITLVASLCLAALIGAATVSPAQQMVARHKVIQKLKFRRTDLFATLAARDGALAVRTSGTAGQIDSTYFSTVGGLANAETTVAIPTANWADIGRTSAILDTGAVVCRLVIAPQGGGGVIDSFYVIPQVSADGETWESCGLLINTTPSNPITGASILTAAIPVALLAGGTGTIAFRDTWTSRTGVDIFGLGSWPTIRFIIKPGISETTTGHINKASLVYWSASDQPNK